MKCDTSLQLLVGAFALGVIFTGLIGYIVYLVYELKKLDRKQKAELKQLGKEQKQGRHQ